MRIEIGKVAFAGRHPGRSPEVQHLLTRHRPKAGRAPVSVYRWDCRLPRGNLDRPAFIALPVHVTGAWPDAQTGALDEAKAAERLDAFAKRIAPGDPGMVQTFIDAAFPPVQFPVPWDRLKGLLTPALGVHVLAWPDYIDLLVSAQGDPAAESVLLSMPVAVLFQAVVTHRCLPPVNESDAPVGAEVRLPVVRDLATLPEASRALFDGWLQERERMAAEGGPLVTPEDQAARDQASAEARDAWRRRLSKP